MLLEGFRGLFYSLICVVFGESILVLAASLYSFSTLSLPFLYSTSYDIIYKVK